MADEKKTFTLDSSFMIHKDGKGGFELFGVRHDTPPGVPNTDHIPERLTIGDTLIMPGGVRATFDGFDGNSPQLRMSKIAFAGIKLGKDGELYPAHDATVYLQQRGRLSTIIDDATGKPIARRMNEESKAAAVRGIMQELAAALEKANNISQPDPLMALGYGKQEAINLVTGYQHGNIFVKPLDEDETARRAPNPRRPAAGGLFPQPPEVEKIKVPEGNGAPNPVTEGYSGGLRGAAEKFWAEISQAEQAEEALRAADIGVAGRDGSSLHLYNKDGVAGDGTRSYSRGDKQIDLSLAEISRMSQTSMAGTNWDEKSQQEHAATREKVKKALDLNGDGNVTKNEIETVAEILKANKGIDLKIENIDALAETLNKGSLPKNLGPRQREH